MHHYGMATSYASLTVVNMSGASYVPSMKHQHIAAEQIGDIYTGSRMLAPCPFGYGQS